MSLTEDQQRLWDRGVALVEGGQLEDAQTAFDTLADMLPSSAPVWLAKGVNLNHLHRYEGALAAVEHGLALDASSGPGWCAKGDALCGLKRYDEGAFAYFKSLMYKFDAKILPWALHALLLAGRYDGVLKATEQFEQFLADKELVWHYRATALYNLDRYEEALAAIGKVLEIGAEEREFDARLVQGHAHFMLGHDEEALAAYEQAIRIRPKAREGWEGKLKVLRRGRHWRALWQGIKDLVAAKPRL